MASFKDAKSRSFLFNQINTGNIPESAFDLSHELKTTTNFQFITPIHIQECLPGDVFKCSYDYLLKAQPLLSPIMHRNDVYIHSFFIPNRLTVPEWSKLISPGDGSVTMAQASSYTPPPMPTFKLHDFVTDLCNAINNKPGLQQRFIEFFGLNENAYPVPLKFFNHLDIPLDCVTLMCRNDYETHIVFDCSEIPNLQLNTYVIDSFITVWNNYYRDQNLELEFPLMSECLDDNGILNSMSYTERFKVYYEQNKLEYALYFFTGFPKAWEKDYFTSALPSPQRGPAVTLSLLGSITIPQQIISSENLAVGIDFTKQSGVFDMDEVSITPTGNLNSSNGGLKVNIDDGESISSHKAVISHNHYVNGNLVVPSQTIQLSDLGLFSIETLRQASKLQEFYEKFSRGGSRYYETLVSFFGVAPSDARLQRPEFLSANKSPITISETIATANSITDEDFVSPQGNKTGNMFASNSKQASFVYQCQEHGFILTVLTIMPRSSYFQGISKHWKRRNYLDFAWPEFANLGEQPVYNYEINAKHENPDNTFGYLPKYTEYKFNSDRTRGDFEDTLAYWTLSRRVTSNVKLNSSFIRADVPTDIFAVQTIGYDQFLLDIWIDCKAVRKLPVFGTPSLS
ncbi:major capsid protein [Capybara microvirus Cap3_SP_475]|nr:major capsid protein [Capybara microvirus Cap3_SP_475]